MNPSAHHHTNTFPDNNELSSRTPHYPSGAKLAWFSLGFFLTVIIGGSALLFN